MTDFFALLQADRGQPAIQLTWVRAEDFESWLLQQPSGARALIAADGFKGRGGDLIILPHDDGVEWRAVVGLEPGNDPWGLAAAAAKLPGGVYRLDGGRPGDATLGWMLAQHRFDRYRSAVEPPLPRTLLTCDPARIDEQVRLSAAVALVRDMVDTPTADMGPANIQAAAEALARQHQAVVTITDSAALAAGFPMIHAVGRAAAPHRQPRLIELEWGDPAHPRIAVIGKGVCFDTGGLDIKPASGMRLMKKDMGGAAHALALAQLIMATALPVRLHLLIPAVENAISGDAFRPGDVLASRKGLWIEIGNTDAEGRLILGDALTRAGEAAPELILDFATLTGAARVALGPDLPALFANDDALAGDLLEAGRAVADPVWRMPLHQGYRDMLKSDIADRNNAPEGGFAGAITAALFLEAFVPDGVPWAHLDTFAWRPSARPGRPAGGDALGLRAAFAMLQQRFASR